jgi:hypothetical protein
MVHPLIKVMLVGGKGDGLMVSVADNATEISVTPCAVRREIRPAAELQNRIADH